MAYTTIDKSSLHMDTKLYTGNAGTKSITSLGFEPSMVWFKSRTNADTHAIFDSVRGVTKRLIPDNNTAEGTQSNGLTHFLSNGFTVGDAGIVNQSHNYASWNWKAGTAVSGNTTGSGTYKTYTGSVNTTSGFSIIRYTGNGSAGHTIPHHLGVAPTFRITKNTSIADWACYMEVLGNTKEMKLSTNALAGTTTNYWNSTSPNTTNFTLGTNGITNANNENYISYNFAPKQGFCSIGQYRGNGNADGSFIFTGHKPSWIMIKRTDANNQWIMLNDKMSLYNNNTGDELYADSSAVQNSFVDGGADFLSNGFKLRGTNGSVNLNGGSYIYMVFAEAPLVGTNNIPANAR